MICRDCDVYRWCKYPEVILNWARTGIDGLILATISGKEMLLALCVIKEPKNEAQLSLFSEEEIRGKKEDRRR